MKRWVIARMGDYENDGGNSPAFAKYTDNYRLWSKPGFSWCFGQIAAPSLTEITADPEIFVLPDGAMDNALSSFPAAVRNNMQVKLTAAGFSFTGVKTTWTLRQLLVFLVQQLQPEIGSVEQGDVRDIET